MLAPPNPYLSGERNIPFSFSPTPAPLLPEGLGLLAAEVATQARILGERGETLSALLTQSGSSLGRMSDVVTALEQEAQETAALTRVLARNIAKLKQRQPERGAR